MGLELSRSKQVAAIAVFSATALALNQVLRIPAPYAPFLKYEIWEIPIILALLIFGLRVGFTVTIIIYLVLQATPQGVLSGPIYNLVAVLSMLLGVILARNLGHRFISSNKILMLVLLCTTLTAVLRVVIMTLMNATLLPYSPPIGYNIPIDQLPWMLILIGIFNATVAMYTIPAAYLLLKAVSIRSTIPAWFLQRR